MLVPTVIYHTMLVYHLAFVAREESKLKYPTTHKTLEAYFQHACQLQDCDMLSMLIVDSTVHLLVVTPGAACVNGLIENLKAWTASWITNGTIPAEKYWMPGFYVDEVAPKEKELILSKFNMHAGLAMPKFCPQTLCYHVIFTTLRAKLTLRCKYSSLLVSIIKELSQEMRVAIEEAGSMRNHVHMLCHLPLQTSIIGFVDALKPELLNRLHANRHFGKVEGWDDGFMAYTVSQTHRSAEAGVVANQENLHHRVYKVNEMAYIYTMFETPYFVSLQ